MFGVDGVAVHRVSSGDDGRVPVGNLVSLAMIRGSSEQVDGHGMRRALRESLHDLNGLVVRQPAMSIRSCDLVVEPLQHRY